MTSRLGSAFSSCAIKSQSESVEVITSSDNLEEGMSEQKTECATSADTTEAQPQSSFLWRLSSGALGGAYNAATGAAGMGYNAATGAAGMGYNSTKWILGKGVEIGSTVAVKSKDMSGNVISKTAEVGSNLVSVMPVPSKFKAKDKKE